MKKEKGELRISENCPVFSVQTVQGLTLFRFIFKSDTLVKSHFCLFQLGTEPYPLTAFSSLQMKHLGSMFHHTSTSHRAAFQAAQVPWAGQGPCPHRAKGRAQALRAHVRLTPKLEPDGASMGILQKVCTQKPRAAFTNQFSS